MTRFPGPIIQADRPHYSGARSAGDAVQGATGATDAPAATTTQAAEQGRAAARAWLEAPAAREPVNPYLTPDMAYGRERISAVALAWRAGFAHETHRPAAPAAEAAAERARA